MVGGRIVGMATAVSMLRQRPSARVVVLEKEDAPAPQAAITATIHSGMYSPARQAQGETVQPRLWMTKQFCAEHGIPVIECGK